MPWDQRRRRVQQKPHGHRGRKDDVRERPVGCLRNAGCDDRIVPTTFTITTRTQHSAEDLFDLSLSIDAHLASMAGSDEQAVAGTTSGQINLDETVTWRARHFGVRLTMTAKVVELDRPRRFIDRQVHGPFRSFVHEHDFLEDDDSTIMTDTFTIASPILGRLTEPFILVPYLRRLITQRNQHMLAVLDARHS